MNSKFSDTPVKVMLIDDEVALTKLTKMNLEANGPYKVETVNQATKAISEASTFRPDIIFLDVMMPDGDGGEIAAQMLETPVLSNTPIVFMTAVIKKNETRRNQGKIGGRIYLAKPVSTQEIMDTITQQLGEALPLAF